MYILSGQVGVRERGVGTGIELRVHDSSLLVRKACSLCCRGLGW